MSSSAQHRPAKVPCWVLSLSRERLTTLGYGVQLVSLKKSLSTPHYSGGEKSSSEFVLQLFEWIQLKALQMSLHIRSICPSNPLPSSPSFSLFWASLIFSHLARWLVPPIGPRHWSLGLLRNPTGSRQCLSGRCRLSGNQAK